MRNNVFKFKVCRRVRNHLPIPETIYENNFADSRIPKTKIFELCHYCGVTHIKFAFVPITLHMSDRLKQTKIFCKHGY